MTLLTDRDRIAIAERYAIATRSNDTDTVVAMSAPGAEIWHNFDNAIVDTAATVKSIGWLHRTVTNLTWEDVALLPTPTGWVSQTILTGIAPGGPIRAYSCVVVTLDADGLISRLDEYLDPAQLAALRSKA
jgi:uncharacterized protein